GSWRQKDEQEQTNETEWPSITFSLPIGIETLLSLPCGLQFLKQVLRVISPAAAVKFPLIHRNGGVRVHVRAATISVASLAELAELVFRIDEEFVGINFLNAAGVVREIVVDLDNPAARNLMRF